MILKGLGKIRSPPCRCQNNGRHAVRSASCCRNGARERANFVRLRLAIFRRADTRPRMARPGLVAPSINRGNVPVGCSSVGRVVLRDLQQLPRAPQLEVHRIWRLRPALAVPSSITIELRNAGNLVIHARVVDETRPQLRLEPPTLELFVRSNRTGSAEYSILPSERGDVRLGRTFIRYQSAMRLAERWAIAETSQVVCVLPNIEEAKKQHALLNPQPPGGTRKAPPSSTRPRP